MEELSKTKGNRGRKAKKYYGHSATEIKKQADSLDTKEVRKKWPVETKDKRARLSIVLKVIGKESGVAHDLPTIERAIRRVKGKAKSGHK